jgi:hypothetical protein
MTAGEPLSLCGSILEEAEDGEVHYWR